MALKAQREKAASFVASYVGGLQNRLAVLNEDMKALDKRIQFEGNLADQLHKAESRDKSYQSQIKVQKGLLDQLDQHVNDTAIDVWIVAIAVNETEDFDAIHTKLFRLPGA